MTSVIVPAFNEATALPRLLSRLLDGAEPGEFEILVVANGCSDDSAEVARSFGPAVRVLETPVPNKHRAMRLADEAAGAHFPRLYVDADVELGCADARLLAAALRDGTLLAAVPERAIGTGDCPWTVRWYYELWLKLPVVRTGLFGRGVIGVSVAGYARLAAIPELMGDDLAASLAFKPAERTVVAGAFARIHPPRTLADLLRRRIRVHTVTAQAGARTELAEAGAAARTSRADIMALIRREPFRMAPRAAWFLYVTALARRRAGRAIAAGDYTTWLRDESSRDRPAPQPADASRAGGAE